MNLPQEPVPYMPPLYVLEKIAELRPLHAKILAEAIVSSQERNEAEWLKEMASILRYAKRATGQTCVEYLQGTHFLDYSKDHQGRLRYFPGTWRHGALEWLGE